MTPQEPDLSPSERSRLVAYLDGELAGAEAQEVAANMARSSAVRREAKAMERAWELLDLLPRPEPSAQLGSRTLSEVRRLGGGDRPLRATAGMGRIAACAAATVLTVAFGYTSARWLWPDPVARLARDLSLAEHLDEYRDVGSFDLLESLVRSGEFEDQGESTSDE